jgi:hypothetical protein
MKKLTMLLITILSFTACMLLFTACNKPVTPDVCTHYKVINVTPGRANEVYYFGGMPATNGNYKKGDTIKYSAGGRYLVDSVITHY